MAENLFGQPEWARRGEGDARLAAAQSRLAAAEVTLARVNTGAWTDWTPGVISDGTQPTHGTGGTRHGRYTRIGVTVIGKLVIHLGTGATSGTGSYFFTLPVAARLPPTDHYIIGTGYVYNAGNGNVVSFELVLSSGNSGAAPAIIHEDVAAAVRFLGATVPFSTGWGAGDRLLAEFTYEAAA